MNYRILLNYPQRERIALHIIDFFWSELTLARTCQNHELWFVSPWITDCNLDLSDRGGFEDLWPGFSRSSIPLSHIIKKFLDYNSTINIVCRPPHLLVPPEGLRDFYEFQTRLDKIDGLFSRLKELQKKVISITTEQKRIKSEIEKAIDEIHNNVDDFRIFLDRFGQIARGQTDVVAFIVDIYNYLPEKVNIYFNSRLHAKMLLGISGGFIGSANITHSGLNFNDELFFYTNDEKLLVNLKKVALKLAYDDGSWWKKSTREYSIFKEYERILGSDLSIKMMMRNINLPEDLKATLELLQNFQ